MTFSNVNDNLTQIQRICLNSLLYFLKGDSEQAYHLISKVPLVGENVSLLIIIFCVDMIISRILC